MLDVPSNDFECGLDASGYDVTLLSYFVVLLASTRSINVEESVNKNN